MSAADEKMSSLLLSELALVEIFKRLHVMARIRSVVHHMMSELQHSRLIEPLSLRVCLLTVEYGEIVLGTPYNAYGIEDFRNKLLPLPTRVYWGSP